MRQSWRERAGERNGGRVIERERQTDREMRTERERESKSKARQGLKAKQRSTEGETERQ